MQERLAYRFRLYPTPHQERSLRRWAGCARAVWNAALEQRRAAWRIAGVSLRYPDQGGGELSEAKRSLPWLSEPHSFDVCQQALRDLDRAFARFFRGEARYPRFRRKGGRERFRIQSRPGGGEISVRRLSRRWGEVRVPKLGWVRFRFSRGPRGEIKHLTVCCDPLGWHVSLCCEREAPAPAAHHGPAVGIDRGVAATVALSTGELRSCPGPPAGQAERLRRLARKAGRQETARRRRPPGERRRSRRHERTLRRLARLRAREARIRKDFLHRLSSELAKSHGVVVIERLRVGDLTRSARGTREAPGHGVSAKAALNRAVLAQGWGELRRQLDYKLARSGGRLIEVPAPYTSQRCARCGAIDPRSRRSQALFACTSCGQRANADVNAARVILAAGLGRDGAWSPLRRHGEEARTAPREVAGRAA